MGNAAPMAPCHASWRWSPVLVMPRWSARGGGWWRDPTQAAQLDGYASDITRTFPANGKFTAPRALYDLVLASQDAAVAATKAGARFNDPHDATVAVLAQGMLDLGCWTRTRWAPPRTIDQRAYFPVLHAPHQPLAGHGCARLWQLCGTRRGGQVQF